MISLSTREIQIRHSQENTRSRLQSRRAISMYDVHRWPKADRSTSIRHAHNDAHAPFASSSSSSPSIARASCSILPPSTIRAVPSIARASSSCPILPPSTFTAAVALASPSPPSPPPLPPPPPSHPPPSPLPPSHPRRRRLRHRRRRPHRLLGLHAKPIWLAWREKNLSGVGAAPKWLAWRNKNLSGVGAAPGDLRDLGWSGSNGYIISALPTDVLDEGEGEEEAGQRDGRTREHRIREPVQSVERHEEVGAESGPSLATGC